MYSEFKQHKAVDIAAQTSMPKAACPSYNYIMSATPTYEVRSDMETK